MVMLADHYDYVIGGDPDRDSVDLAVIDTRTGGIQAQIAAPADGPGYQRLLDWGRAQAPGRRVWALEGTASFAAGFVACLAHAGEDVVEVGGIKRARGAKNDRIDAVRAGRHALSSEQPSDPAGARVAGGAPVRPHDPPRRPCQSHQGHQRAQERHRDRPRTPPGGPTRRRPGQST